MSARMSLASGPRRWLQGQTLEHLVLHLTASGSLDKGESCLAVSNYFRYTIWIITDVIFC